MTTITYNKLKLKIAEKDIGKFVTIKNYWETDRPAEIDIAAIGKCDKTVSELFTVIDNYLNNNPMAKYDMQQLLSLTECMDWLEATELYNAFINKIVALVDNMTTAEIRDSLKLNKTRYAELLESVRKYDI